MDDKKYNTYVKLLNRSSDPFEGLNFNKNQQSSYRRKAHTNFRLNQEGNLLQAVNRNVKARILLKSATDVANPPVLGEDFSIHTEKQTTWVKVIK